jgi:Lysozyme like domain
MWPLLVLLILGTRTLVRRLTIQQLRDLARRSGFPLESIDVAAAVAMAESGGHPDALGDFGRSFGLWQIHTPAHPQYRGADLFDPDYNARAAFAISKGGTDWSPWTTFRNGEFRRFLGG